MSPRRIVLGIYVVGLLIQAPFFEPGAEEGLPAVGTIDFYGLRTVTEQQVREKLGVKEGDQLTAETREAAIRRLESISHVARADLSIVFPPGSKKIALFVGIEEKGAPHFAYRPKPDGSARLPDVMVQAEHDLIENWMTMVQRGNAKEDDSQGHALMDDPAVRAIQE